MHGKDWTSEYYDVMEFYFWEPQHLGKSKNSNSQYTNEKDVLDHIQNMEVSLNHMFNVFFRLIPTKFVNLVISNFCDLNMNDTFTLQGTHDVSKFSGLVQPDLLFNSNKSNFSIEMKIGSKSSLEQVYKYALLHWLEQKHSNTKKKSILLYIGKGDFKSLWTKKYLNTDELIQSAIEFDIEHLKGKASRTENININWDEVRNVLLETRIGYCSYTEFASILTNYKKQIPSNIECSETLEKLIGGLYCELTRRGLA